MEIWDERSSMYDMRDIQDRAGRQEFLSNEISRVTAMVGLSCLRLGHISEGWAQSSRLRVVRALVARRDIRETSQVMRY